jgi:hypothetical protein
MRAAIAGCRLRLLKALQLHTMSRCTQVLTSQVPADSLQTTPPLANCQSPTTPDHVNPFPTPVQIPPPIPLPGSDPAQRSEQQVLSSQAVTTQHLSQQTHCCCPSL